jgi:transglutaminase-like putative cysteine protease
LLAVFFICSAYSQNKITVSQHPSWVDFQDYNKSPEVDEGEITQGTLILLADYQTNILKQEVYFRLVTKITDNVGIQSGSNINAVYDPLYQKLTFHAINIIRDGKKINKLIPDHFQVIRRELNAENFIYDGTLSAMLNMADVRNGDIIDLSYTTKGFNPIHNGKFSNSFVLNDYVPIGKINVSINTKNKLNYKTYNTTHQPKIIKKNGIINYNWTVETPDRFSYEDNIPPWKIVMSTIVVSDYKSWKEVVKWAANIYSTNETLSTVLKMKVSEISASYKTQGEKIKAILDFVQNDIRYLGLEYGIGSYKPNSPNKVFEQRYGDCKDKSLLMVQMLKEINVEAYPMLLNTTMKSTITELPPSPTFFDHCVVKVIDEEKRELYYDPTIYNQGGTYKNTHFPNYEYGLVIKKNNRAFDTIMSSSDNKVTTLEEYVIKEVNGGATLNVTSTYTDVEADRMRNYFKNNSKSTIIKEYENYYANFYSKIKIVDKPSVNDDVSKNEFKVTESYAIDSIWRPMEMKPDFIAIDFVPSSLKEVLYVPNMENRKNAMALQYPVSREHRTNIILPSAWQIEKNNDIVSNAIFYYDFNVEFDKKKNEVQLKSYLKIQKPSVTPDEFTTYYKDLNALEKSFGYTIFIPKNPKKLQDSNFFLSLGKIAFFLFLIGGFIFFLIWILSKKKKTYI